MDSIARTFNISTQTVIRDNQIKYPYRLVVDQALYISNGDSVYDRTPLYASGYVCPFIGNEMLEKTLPFLNGLEVFSHGFTLEGELVPPMADDTWMIEKALQQGARPILMLTPLGGDGHFSNNLVSGLVRGHELQQRLIWELGRTMQGKGFGGLGVDFERVLAGDRKGFAVFVNFATRVTNLFGYPVSVALAPKTSAEQRGLLYESINHTLLGAAASRAMLVTYEWGYNRRPPVTVTPINMMKRMVDYAITTIPREKLSLGIPSCGYDWVLPYGRGVTRTRTINNGQAVQITIDFEVSVRSDETTMSPYFRYWQYGIQHEVWSGDVRSIKTKFDPIKEYGLSGAGYQQPMSFFRANWLMLNQMLYIEREWQVMERLNSMDGT